MKSAIVAKTRHSRFSMKPLAMAALMALSTGVAADKPHHAGHPHKQNHFDYAKVLQATPIIEQVRISDPVRECWQQPVTRISSTQPNSGTNAAGGMLVGGLIGGILGNQVGRGRGKNVATAVGTLVGAQLGREAGRSAQSTSYQHRHTSYQQVCEVTDQVSYQQVVKGYRVSYRYRGTVYHTRLPYDPGDKIKLKVSVEPVI